LDKKTIRFIVNPFSGVSQKQNIHEVIKENLDASMFEFDLMFTQAPLHAKEIAQQSVDEQIDTIIAIGGDGTVNEVASPLLNTNCKLGIIPGGSGNGFAMHLGIGRNMKKAIKHLNHSKEITIDTCKLNDEFYLNLAGVGFDASVAYFTKQSSSRGFKVYFNNAMKEALNYQNMRYKIQYEDTIIEDKFLSINVANASMFGYNFKIAPLADLHDGLLDVVMIKDASKARYITSVWRFLNSSLHKSPIVNVNRTRQLSIESDQPMHYHRDGEGAMTSDKLVFSINPSSLKVLVPEAYSL